MADHLLAKRFGIIDYKSIEGQREFMDILLASTNRGKLIEIQDILKEYPFKLLTPDMLSLELEVEETGSTYRENAVLKAQAYARRSGLISLGDDTGLEVEALDGQPGIHSARFVPRRGARDADRRALLLQKLAGIPRPWAAHFVCVVAVAEPDGVLHTFEGACIGEIIPEERGEHGFGYDAIFWMAEHGCTMAELDMEVKNQISHRARAVRAAVPILLNLQNRK